MSEKTSGSSLQRLVLNQLRDPIRLRFALGVLLLAAWYFGFYSPMCDRIVRNTALTESERRRAATAQQIEGLRKVLVPFTKRIPEHAGQNELVQYVMAHVRQSPVKLVDLKPTKTRELGPFDNIGLRLQFDASYEDLDAFLGWVENDHRLLRVDSLKVEPTKDHALLNVQLDLLSLAEKEKNNLSERPGAGGKMGSRP
jgi:Tfp pilus assembly protein PilO